MLEATLNVPSAAPVWQLRLLDQLRGCRQFPALIEEPIAVDPLGWLHAQRSEIKIAWSDRESGELTVALGVAARQIRARSQESLPSVLTRCREQLPELPGLRWFGGFAFRTDPYRLPPPWNHFGRAAFWLPCAMLTGGRLSILVLDANDLSIAEQCARQLVASRQIPADLPPWLERIDQPERSDWRACMEQATRLFGDEVLEKIVLARQVTLQFATRLEPWWLLQKLRAVAPHCYHFGFQVSPHVAFIGATPERLFARRGRELQSEVVAGTRRRGSTELEDQRLSSELLTSAKDQLEHDIVRKSIRQRLHGCVERLDVDARATVLKLATKQHLISRVTGTLRNEVGDEDLIERLHPTPAVGGYPTENALSEIQRLENFERGWFAAPVGWISAEEAEFAVAIRSALADHRQLHLYSGAGIVPGSVANCEWDELEAKISDFLQLFPSGAATSDAGSP